MPALPKHLFLAMHVKCYVADVLGPSELYTLTLSSESCSVIFNSVGLMRYSVDFAVECTLWRHLEIKTGATAALLLLLKQHETLSRNVNYYEQCLVKLYNSLGILPVPLHDNL